MFKNFKLFAVVALLAATTMFFVSCSKESQIEGKWKVTRAYSSDADFSDDKGETWNFKDGGTGSATLFGMEFDMDWAVSGDNLTIELDGVYYSGYRAKCTGDFDIETLNSSDMELEGTWTIKVDGETEARVKVEYDMDKK